MNPTIERCLDADAMREALQRALPAMGRIERVRIDNVRRNASRRRNPHAMTLCCEIDAVDPADHRSTQAYYGQVFRDGASAHAAQAAPHALHVAEFDLLLWPWPHDPRLPQLPALLDAEAPRPWWDAPASDVKVLRYVPECRATLRYRHADGRALYAKTFSDHRGEAIHQRFEHFWLAANEDARQPLVAEPLRYCHATRTVWQESAHGVPLRDAALDDDQAARVAQALAAVHGAPRRLAGPETRDRAHWLAEIARRRQKIARAGGPDADWAERAESVAQALQRNAATLPAREPTVIHGDCHAGQVGVHGDRIVLFDFDEFCLGDPMEDLAAFVTRLDAGTGAFAVELVASYARVAPQHFCSASLAWHLALQQLLQASRAFVFQVPDWRGEVERRLARAGAQVQRWELAA